MLTLQSPVRPNHKEAMISMARLQKPDIYISRCSYRLADSRFSRINWFHFMGPVKLPNCQHNIAT